VIKVDIVLLIFNTPTGLLYSFASSAFSI
jgi:hypothetical protein